MNISTIETALDDFRQGKLVIVVDDEDRENEGDLIMAAELCTEEHVNFMLRKGRGVLCAPITTERAEELGNSRDTRLLQTLQEFPLLYTTAHITPFSSDTWNKVAGICFPIGLILWLRIWVFRVRLREDLQQIAHTAKDLQTHCQRIAELAKDGKP